MHVHQLKKTMNLSAKCFSMLVKIVKEIKIKKRFTHLFIILTFYLLIMSLLINQTYTKHVANVFALY
jgi:hypothetical protein